MSITGLIALEALHGDRVTLYRKEPFTGKVINRTFNMSYETFMGKLEEYQSTGKMIQDVFTELDADEREFIMTGIDFAEFEMKEESEDA